MSLESIPSAIISSVVSAFLFVHILKSRIRLKRPYRRLVIGVIFHGFLLALNSIISPFVLPEGTQGSSWAIKIATDTPCRIEGFFMQMAVMGSPLYILSLAIYYLFTVKYEMPDDVFAKSIEPQLHIFSNAWPLLTAMVTTATGNNNPSSSFSSCWVTPKPENCLWDEGVECTRGANGRIYDWVFISAPLFLSTIVFLSIMINVCLIVLDHQRKINQYSLSWQTGCLQPTNQVRGEEITTRRPSFFSVVFANPPPTENSVSQEIQELQASDINNVHQHQSSAVPLARSQTRPSRSRNRDRDRTSKRVINQAIIFCSVYCILNGMMFTHGILQRYGSIPDAFQFAFNAIYPMQGFLYIFVLTRPYVITLRRRNKEYSWIKAFWITIQSGGDEDKISFRRRRSSARTRSVRTPQNGNLPIDLSELKLDDLLQSAPADVDPEQNEDITNENMSTINFNHEKIIQRRISEVSSGAERQVQCNELKLEHSLKADQVEIDDVEQKDVPNVSSLEHRSNNEIFLY